MIVAMEESVEQEYQPKERHLEHQPVMLSEVLEGLNIYPNGIYIDATFGRGGHARAILSKLTEKGRLLVIDRDPEAIKVAKTLSEEDPRVIVRKGTLSELQKISQEEGMVGKINGVLMDLGVSSPQLEDASRGFSFRLDGPLDMRMDPSQGISAAEWLNQAEESEIAWVLKTYGEERFYRRMARAIVMARQISPLTSTRQLAEIIAKANPAWEKHKHPATRCFQAIRIFINDELTEVGLGLEQALAVLMPGGRLVVISFHSLEDRIVKRFIQKEERGDEYPQGLPVLASQIKQKLRRVGGKRLPSDDEIKENVRARSAVVRIAEKRDVLK